MQLAHVPYRRGPGHKVPEMEPDPAPKTVDAAVPLDQALLVRDPQTRVWPNLLSAYARAAAPNSLHAFRSVVRSITDARLVPTIESTEDGSS